jgi:acetyl-CoA carboxylase biotin carboxyl carrier protein
MTLRFDQVADLIKIIDASACQELVLETTELKLVVRRGSSNPPASPQSTEAPQPTRGSVKEPQVTRAGAPVDGEGTQSNRAGVHEVRSPMVGTFYRAPSPDSPPFVDLGMKVKSGQPVCVIEVMKLFTTIYADLDGEIKHIGASNGELVEYGRVLFVIAQEA